MTLLTSVVAVVATFLPWITFDATRTVDRAPDVTPDFVPDRLIDTASVYRASAHTLLGLGTFLAFLVIVAAAMVVLGYRGRGRWQFILAATTYVIASGLAGVSIVMLRVAAFGYRWVLPDDWVGDSPVVTIGLAGLAFVIATAVAAVFTARLAFARKRVAR